jgi:hypothetical protein
VAVLARICSDDFIAGMLNRHGFKTGRGITGRENESLRCEVIIAYLATTRISESETLVESDGRRLSVGPQSQNSPLSCRTR